MAFSGATHDIAGDGLYMDTLDFRNNPVILVGRVLLIMLQKVFTNGLIIYLAGVLEKQWV